MSSSLDTPKEYNDYVESKAPKSPLFKRLL